MALWDKLKTELDRAGRAAQTAIDEGKVRLDVMRVRQLADKAAETLGYALFNARRDGGELDSDSYTRLSTTLAAHMAEVDRLEAQLARASHGDTTAPSGTAGGSPTAEGDTAGAAPEAATAAPYTAPPESPSAASEPAGQPTPRLDHVDPAMGDNPDRSVRRGY